MKKAFFVLAAMIITSALPGAGQEQDAVAPPSAQPAAARPLIDVNTATEAELRTLPGVDQETARRIIAARPFPNMVKFIDALRMPPAEAKPMLRYVVISGATTPKELPPAPKTTPGGAPAPRPSTRPKMTNAGERNLTVPTAPGFRPALPVEQRADINSATPEELQRAGMIDAMSARRIVANRPYRALADLSKAGFLHEKIVELSRYFRVNRTKK